MTSSQRLVLERCKVCIEIANQKLNAGLSHPQIKFNILGKTAGSAQLQRWTLRFNPVLLEENLADYLQNVVPHEICHLVAYHLYGPVRPHGKEWQGLMRSLFAIEPQTYHQFDVSSVEGKTFAYQCQCSTIKLSIRRHNKVQKKQTQYQCRRCKQRLIYIKT